MTLEDETNEIERRVRRGLNNIYLRQLSKISLVMGLYYAFISVSHFFVLTGSERYWVMGGSLTAMIAGGAIFTLIRLEKISPDISHISFLPAGLSAVFAVFIHVFVSGDLLQLTNGALIMFAIGFITLSVAMFSIMFAVASLLYFAALYYIPDANTMHFAFMYVALAALSIMCFALRYRTVYSSERLLISNRDKAAKLVEASKRIQDNIDEVRAAAEAAERANVAKDTFLANTTHELRTPLTGVLGMMDFLSKTGLDEEQRQVVAAAQFSARTLLVVVNDLLDIAKMDAGKLEIKQEPFMPAAVVSQVVDLLRSKASAKNLELSIHGLRHADIPVIGDPVRIGQIVLNLTDNAIKFTDEGEVVVALKMRENDDNSLKQGQASLHITVQDSGPGISDEDQKRLFTRFGQLDNTAARSAEGAGLGLSICMGLASHMGGRIAVDSEEGMGSTFSLDIDLPVAKGDDAEKAKMHAPSDVVVRPDVVAAPPLTVEAIGETDNEATEEEVGRRILLAEDNAVNQMLMRKIANAFGWDLTVVNNGEEAVFKIEDEDVFDLVLMDIRMPKMDGVQAVQRIRRMKGDKGKMPVVALTANTGADQETVYLQQGMSAIVGKPIDPATLNTVVEELITGNATSATGT